jgi:uncharacterized protein YecE (DUF72 family)
MAKGEVLIGTSGWVYKEWAEKFYPKDIKQRDWLPYFAERYPCVEVNSTFYRLPLAKTVARWAEIVPPGFVFVFKIWRMVSHYKKLHGVEGALADFLRLVAPVRGHAGPLLLQLPPGLQADVGLLEGFLKLYDKAAEDWPLAVEFRHASWYGGGITPLLDRYGVARVVHDMPGSACGEPNAGAPLVYVRYHGAGEKYGGDYADARLAKDAKRIEAWRNDGRTVYVFFNNDRGGHALENADRLNELALSA